MKFTKMQGCGNDYVYVNCFIEEISNPVNTAIKVSDRRFGIGSDGLVLIKPSENEDFFMDMYNIDGSRGSMCGNAIRCVGKYVYEHGMTVKKSLAVETLGGTKYLELITDGDNKVIEVSVDMGKPVLRPEFIPMKYGGDSVINEKVTVLDKDFYMTCISVGNPHAVIFLDKVKSNYTEVLQLKDFDVERYGRIFEVMDIFPEGVNTEFVEVLNRNEINMRVWERGSGETHACGTGATASAYGCMVNGYTDGEVIVHMLGGDLKIRFDKKEDKLYMIGPAVTVFDGELF